MINLGDYKHIVFLDVDDNGVTDVVTYQEGDETVIKKINNEIIMVISDIFDVYLLKTKI